MRKLTTIPALLALACLMIISSWWLIQLSSLPRMNPAAISALSLQAARTLLLLQLMSICLFAPLWATVSMTDATQTTVGAQIISPLLAAIVPAWPLLALLWLATGLPATAGARIEAMILGIGLIIVLVARAIQRLGLNTEIARLLLTSLGFTAAITAWLCRAAWLQWITV